MDEKNSYGDEKDDDSEYLDGAMKPDYLTRAVAYFSSRPESSKTLEQFRLRYALDFAEAAEVRRNPATL